MMLKKKNLLKSSRKLILKIIRHSLLLQFSFCWGGKTWTKYNLKLAGSCSIFYWHQSLCVQSLDNSAGFTKKAFASVRKGIWVADMQSLCVWTRRPISGICPVLSNLRRSVVRWNAKWHRGDRGGSYSAKQIKRINRNWSQMFLLPFLISQCTVLDSLSVALSSWYMDEEKQK